jgi:hypothetical protein
MYHETLLEGIENVDFEAGERILLLCFLYLWLICSFQTIQKVYLLKVYVQFLNFLCKAYIVCDIKSVF